MKKNITLSAEDDLIRKAREKAIREKKSLNTVFREWLARYVRQDASAERYEELMKKLSYARSGGKFSGQEMNER